MSEEGCGWPGSANVFAEDDPEGYGGSAADEDHPRRLIRQNAFVGVKRPAAVFHSDLACDERVEPESDEDGRPDLALFFERHGVPLKERVSLCRTYASYVASILPKKRKVGASRRSPLE